MSSSRASALAPPPSPRCLSRLFSPPLPSLSRPISPPPRPLQTRTPSVAGIAHTSAGYLRFVRPLLAPSNNDWYPSDGSPGAALFVKAAILIHRAAYIAGRHAASTTVLTRCSAACRRRWRRIPITVSTHVSMSRMSTLTECHPRRPGPPSRRILAAGARDGMRSDAVDAHKACRPWTRHHKVRVVDEAHVGRVNH